MGKALLIAALAAAGCAQQPTAPASSLDAAGASLAAAESAFAAHSVREDMRAAFLAHFAADGVMVRDGWANSNDVLRTEPAPPIVLDWRPVHTEVAASGELGLSTGPWKATSKDKPAAPPAFGQYVSVWRREAGAAWKVEVDIGIENPGNALWDRPLDTSAPSGSVASAARTIESAELDFVSDADSQGPRAAYARHGADRMRFYRGGFAPAVGKQAALASPAMTDAKHAWEIDRVEISRSRDFGYARGSYAALAQPGKPLGYFLRVWRILDGQWRIVMDVSSPAKR